MLTLPIQTSSSSEFCYRRTISLISSQYMFFAQSMFLVREKILSQSNCRILERFALLLRKFCSEQEKRCLSNKNVMKGIMLYYTFSPFSSSFNFPHYKRETIALMREIAAFGRTHNVIIKLP